MELADCGATEDDSLFEGTVTAANDGTEAVMLTIVAEIVDEDGTRVAEVGTNEQPLVIGAGETDSTTLTGAAWPVDDTSVVDRCEIYVIEAV